MAPAVSDEAWLRALLDVEAALAAADAEDVMRAIDGVLSEQQHAVESETRAEPAW